MRRLVAAALAASAAASTVSSAGGAVTFRLSSPAFGPGTRIPVVYTCDGRNVSPPLRWTKPPRGTRSLALLVDDPDAPIGTFTHWIAYNISPARRALPVDARLRFEGVNDAGRVGYTGPCPPSGTHRYLFRLYALTTTLQLEIRPARGAFLNLVRARSIAVATMIGRYRR